MKTHFTYLAAAILSIAILEPLHAQEDEESLIIPPKEVPSLDPAAPYEPKDNIVEVELCEYAGYAGLLLANNGLEPNEDSFFYKNYGFKVLITLNEEENWSPINSGKLAASGTTVDVLAVYGQQLNVTCPAMFCFSRGGDGFVVRKEMQSVRDLFGKTVVASRYTDSEFFIRFLASRNDIPIYMRQGLVDPPQAGKLNLIYTPQVDYTTEVFENDLNSGGKEFIGCVGWDPMTTEVVQNSKGKADFFATTRNQLIISDILILNRGFSDKYPDMAKGLVHGLLEGNRVVNKIKQGDASEEQLNIVAKALTTDPDDPWDIESLLDELGSCDFTSRGLNEAFLEDRMVKGGSFASLYNESIKAYELPADSYPGPEKFIDTEPSKALSGIPELASADIDLKSIGGLAEGKRSLVVWKDVRFQFVRNVYDQIRDDDGENARHFNDIASYLRYSPGSIVKLIGHLDDSEAKRRGRSWRNQYNERAVQASLDRARTIKRALVARYGISDTSIEIDGKGWNSPAGNAPITNRRVEVQMFSLE